MRKKFNDTGLCVPGCHYMVDTSHKIDQIMRLVEDGEYFTINRPRQFGKTTTLSLIAKALNRRHDYVAVGLSFEGIDSVTYQDQQAFITVFLRLLREEFEYLDFPDQIRMIDQRLVTANDMQSLSECLTALIKSLTPQKAWVLLIDEVDKSANNQLFLDFLGMLRKKYLRRSEGKESTFQSVILAGVHDIKTLKMKIRTDAEQRLNSPWNIAIDFTIDLSFQPGEIVTMLRDYQQDKQINMDVPTIADKLYYYTSGYPYLVSKLCKFIDETIMPERDNPNWDIADAETAFRLIARESYSTTLFDSLAKNLENDQDLYDLVFQIVMNGQRITFTTLNPVISRAHLYGILTELDGQCVVHNRIYEQKIYAYMLSKVLLAQMGGPFPSSEFFTDTGLNVPMILQKFQMFMKEQYSHKDQTFLEREGRLLFLAFLKPIINGKGFEFKEPAVAEERRMDVVITYGHHRYVIELKIWRGPKYHQEGLRQLSDYLDIYSLKDGYLLIYDFNAGKTYKQEQITFLNKHIFAVWV